MELLNTLNKMRESKQEMIENLTRNIVEGTNELNQDYEAIQILPELKERYPFQLRPEILSVRMYQIKEACYLEITEDKNPEKVENEYDKDISDQGYSNVDYLVNRTSLSFIWGDEGPVIKPSASIVENAYAIIEEFDDDVLLNCTDIFSDEGAKDLLNKITD